MKRLAMLAISIYVAGSSTPTMVNVDPGSYLDMLLIPRTCAEDQLPPTCPPPVVSTGPYILRVSTQPNSDCYKIPYIYPNGTCGPSTWVPCQ